MTYWDDGSTAEDHARFRAAVARTATRLRDNQLRHYADPQAHGALIHAWAMAELSAEYGADAMYAVVGLILDQISEHAPDGARDEDGRPVLHRLVEHRLDEDEVTARMLAEARRAAIEPLAPAEAKAHYARTARAGDVAQQLLGFRRSTSGGAAAAFGYTMLLMEMSADTEQFNAVLTYLLSVTQHLEWTAGAEAA